MAWPLCWVVPLGTLLWKHHKLPWPGRLKVAAQPKHLWQQQLQEQQAEPWKRRDLTGNVCTWSLASSLVIIKDEGRQTGLGAGQSTPVWTQEGKIAAWGAIDLSRWKRLADSQLFPVAQLSSSRPEGQRRRQQAWGWELTAIELAGNRREGRLLFLASALVENRHTAVTGAAAIVTVVERIFLFPNDQGRFHHRNKDWIKTGQVSLNVTADVTLCTNSQHNHWGLVWGLMCKVYWTPARLFSHRVEKTDALALCCPGSAPWTEQRDGPSSTN